MDSLTDPAGEHEPQEPRSADVKKSQKSATLAGVGVTFSLLPWLLELSLTTLHNIPSVDVSAPTNGMYLDTRMFLFSGFLTLTLLAAANYISEGFTRDIILELLKRFGGSTA